MASKMAKLPAGSHCFELAPSLPVPKEDDWRDRLREIIDQMGDGETLTIKKEGFLLNVRLRRRS